MRLPHSILAHTHMRRIIGASTTPDAPAAPPASSIAAWSYAQLPTATGLADEKNTGDPRAVQPGYALSFDGVDDRVEVAAHPLSGHTGDWTITARVRMAATANYPQIVSGNTGDLELRFHSGSSKLSFLSAGISATGFSDNSMPLNTWFLASLSFESSTKTFRLYENGVLAKTVVGTGTDITWPTSMRIGARATNTFPFTGQIDDVRIYTTRLTASQLVDVSNESSGQLIPDAAWYHFEESTGTTAYDSSGNGNHGTLVNGPTYTATGEVSRSWANDFGYSDGAGGVIVPRDESDPTNDVLGSPLTYSGKVPRPSRAHSSPCRVWDGVDDHLVASHLSGSETVVSSGGTSTPTVSAGRIDFTAGTCWDLVLSDGTRYVMSETGGTTCHTVDGTTNHSTYTGGPTVGTQDDLHWAHFYGHGGAPNRVPARADKSALATGGAIANPSVAPGLNDSGSRFDFTAGQPNDPLINGLNIHTDYGFGDSLVPAMSKRVVSGVLEDQFYILEP